MLVEITPDCFIDPSEIILIRIDPDTETRASFCLSGDSTWTADLYNGHKTQDAKMALNQALTLLEKHGVEIHKLEKGE